MSNELLIPSVLVAGEEGGATRALRLCFTSPKPLARLRKAQENYMKFWCQKFVEF